MNIPTPTGTWTMTNQMTIFIQDILPNHHSLYTNSMQISHQVKAATDLMFNRQMFYSRAPQNWGTGGT